MDKYIFYLPVDTVRYRYCHQQKVLQWPQTWASEWYLPHCKKKCRLPWVGFRKNVPINSRRNKILSSTISQSWTNFSPVQVYNRLSQQCKRTNTWSYKHHPLLMNIDSNLWQDQSHAPFFSSSIVRGLNA